MLTENPKLGQVVRATQDVYSDENEEYLIKDQWYEVAGVDENPYHIDETGGRCYIDEAAWHLYELSQNDKFGSVKYYEEKETEHKKILSFKVSKYKEKIKDLNEEIQSNTETVGYILDENEDLRDQIEILHEAINGIEKELEQPKGLYINGGLVTVENLQEMIKGGN